MVEIYKISFWKKSERIAEVKCSVFTKNPYVTMMELTELDYGLVLGKETDTVIRYIDRPDIGIESVKIKTVNRTPHKKVDHGM